MKSLVKRPEFWGVLLAIILGSIWYVSFSEPKLLFTRELVEITLPDKDAESVLLTGIYEFYNDGDRNFKFPIGFPFVIDEDCEYPLDIKIEYAPIEKNPESVSEYKKMSLDFEPLEYKKRGKIVVFPLPVEGEKYAVLKISYSQKIHNTKYTYITTTTQLWKELIKEAIFKLKFPKSIKNVKSNYKRIEESVVDDEYSIHTFQFKDFLPEEDFQIEWSKN